MRSGWLARSHPVIDLQTLDSLDTDQLRTAVRALAKEVHFKQATIDKLTHENAVLKRLKFAAQSEAYTGEQKSLLEETLDMDLAAVAAEIEALRPITKPSEKKSPKRQTPPPHLPRREFRHEPESTTCGCGAPMKRIGEDVAEKLDYEPGVFTVERHVRGKWACACCEKIVQAPVAPHIIDKGLPTAGLLAQVLVAKYLDHLPLYRQEAIFERAGMAIARSTLAQWVGECGVQLQPLVDALAAQMLRHDVLHADETPVAMLKPGHGKTHRAYLWSYCTTKFNPLKAVVFDFAESRGGQSDPQQRCEVRRRRSRPVADALHQWLVEHRRKVPEGSATARAIGYSLNRWAALTRYIDDGDLPIGRVEMWRGGRRSGLSVSAPFVWRCPSNLAVAPFPHPPRRTGRADCPHPALFRRIKPSRSSGRVRAAAGVSAPTSRRGTGRSIGDTPFPACRCAFAARSACVAPHSRRWIGKFASPVLD